MKDEVKDIHRLIALVIWVVLDWAIFRYVFGIPNSWAWFSAYVFSVVVNHLVGIKTRLYQLVKKGYVR